MPLDVRATIRGTDAVAIDATVRDVSRVGCLVASPVAIEPGTIISIGISGIGRINARVVRQTGELHGCSFLWPIARALVEAARTADTVVPLRHLAADESTMPDPDRWPPATRGALIVGAGAGSWALVYMVCQLF